MQKYILSLSLSPLKPTIARLLKVWLIIRLCELVSGDLLYSKFNLIWSTFKPTMIIYNYECNQDIRFPTYLSILIVVHNYYKMAFWHGYTLTNKHIKIIKNWVFPLKKFLWCCNSVGWSRNKFQNSNI